MTRWLVVAGDFPFPTWNGGRLETFTRLTAAIEGGVSLSLLATVKTPPATAERWALRWMLPLMTERRRGRIRSSLVFWLPYQVASRKLRRKTLRTVRAAHVQQPFAWIIAEGLPTMAIARTLSSKLGVPVALRTQNVESHYFKTMARFEPSLKKAAWLAESLRLSRFERRVGTWKELKAVINITVDDAASHARVMLAPQRVVGPSCPPAAMTAEATPRPVVLYFAYLQLPINSAAATWFMRAVWPEVLSRVPAAELLLAGRGASRKLTHLFDSAPRVRWAGEVADPRVLYEQARISVNPAEMGAGISMKNVESLQHSIPVVASLAAARGFPDGSGVVGAASAQEFIEDCVRLLLDDAAWRSARRDAEQHAQTLTSAAQHRQFKIALASVDSMLSRGQ